MNLCLSVTLAASLCLSLSNTLVAEAQQTPAPPPGTVEPTRPVPPTPETLPLVPPEPQLELEPPIFPNQLPSGRGTANIKQIEVRGSTIFSKDQLAKVVAPFINQDLDYEQILGIRSAIAELYISQGYTTSGAFLPEQNITDGTVVVQVVEGEVERVEILGLERLHDSYARSRLQAATKTPLNIQRLGQALQLLQLDPLLQQVQAELIGGTAIGRSILFLNLREAPPLSAGLVFDNSEIPSVGSNRGSAVVGYNNVFLGVGDRLSADFGLTEGVTSFGISYAIPLNSNNGTLSLRYDNGRNRVIEDPFAEVGIRGRSEIYAVSYRQPLKRTPTSEFALSFSGEVRRSRTFLFEDEPFSFTEGPEEGRSGVSVLRFSQDWTKRSPRRVSTARSQFSLGIDAFDATVNNTGTDGRFLSWLGQFQWLQALNEERDFTLVFQVGAQLTGDSLLPLEQFSIGGVDTVRGYRTNQRVGDNGVFGSLELRLPVVRDQDGFGLLQVTPFVDVGTIWSNGDEAGAAIGTLVSTGLGLRWQAGNTLSARINYGIPLVPVSDRGDSLQDSGITFSVQWQPF